MRVTEIPIFLLPFLATAHALQHAPIPRSLDAILVEPRSPVPSPSPSPTPFIKHLDLRQQAAAPAAAAPAQAAPDPNAAPAAANPNANANAQAAPAPANANAQAAPAAANPDPNAAPAAAPAPVPGAAAPAAAAPAAPAAGVGGAGNVPPAAQPAPGAQANSVTTINVQTVINGVTTTTQILYTQSFGAAASAPPVQTGSIGMGTLTGSIGVVKTQSAKSDAVAVGRRGWRVQEMAVLLVSGLAVFVGGGVMAVAQL